jgi:hypothetical protein
MRRTGRSFRQAVGEAFNAANEVIRAGECGNPHARIVTMPFVHSLASFAVSLIVIRADKSQSGAVRGIGDRRDTCHV